MSDLELTWQYQLTEFCPKQTNAAYVNFTFHYGPPYIIHEALIATSHDCAYHWLLASNLLWRKPVYADTITTRMFLIHSKPNVQYCIKSITNFCYIEHKSRRKDQDHVLCTHYILGSHALNSNSCYWSHAVLVVDKGREMPQPKTLEHITLSPLQMYHLLYCAYVASTVWQLIPFTAFQYIKKRRLVFFFCIQVMSGSHSVVQYTRTTVLWPWRTLVKMILPCSVKLTSLLVVDNLKLVKLGLSLETGSFPIKLEFPMLLLMKQ